MNFLVVLLSVVASAAAMSLPGMSLMFKHDKKDDHDHVALSDAARARAANQKCQRSKIERNAALPGPGATTVKGKTPDEDISVVNFPRAAFIEDMCLEGDQKDYIKRPCIKKVTYGWDTDTPTVWVKGKCRAKFIIRYAVAYHSILHMDSEIANNAFVKTIPPHPCQGDTRIFSLKVLKEHDRHNYCGILDFDHTGQGFAYGFYNTNTTRAVWADRGCFATFKICEVSSEHFLDEKMTSLEDHAHDHAAMKHKEEEKYKHTHKMSEGDANEDKKPGLHGLKDMIEDMMSDPLMNDDIMPEHVMEDKMPDHVMEDKMPDHVMEDKMPDHMMEDMPDHMIEDTISDSMMEDIMSEGGMMDDHGHLGH